MFKIKQLLNYFRVDKNLTTADGKSFPLECAYERIFIYVYVYIPIKKIS